MAGGLTGVSVAEALKRLFEAWRSGRRKGLVLTLVAVQSLRERGEEVTEEAVRREGLRILRETKGKVDWGVTEEEYTPALVSSLLRELVEMGVLEEVEGAAYRVYRIRDGRRGEEEFYLRFGTLLQLVRMPR